MTQRPGDTGGSNPASAQSQTNSYTEFFTQVLRGLGLPTTQANIDSFMSVAHIEGINDYYNPINSVAPEPGSTDFNNVGVQKYPDFETGVQGTIDILSGSHWTGLRAALAKGNSLSENLSAWESAYTWAPGIRIPPNTAGLTSSLGANTGTGNPSAGNVVDGSGGGFGGSGNSAPSSAEYKNSLGDLGRALAQIPDLQQILKKAMAGDWSIGKFTNAVDNSDWYKNHSATARSIIVQKLTDPATYQQTLNQTQETIQQLASQNGWDLNQAQLQGIAQHALLTGNDSNTGWLEQAIGKRQDYGQINSTDDLQGNMATTVDQLQQYASEYGQSPSAHALAHAAKQVLMGNQTVDTYKQQYLAQAKSMFPGLSTQLDSGQTVSDIADPYVQSMSNLLEVDPNTLSVRTPLIRKALQGTQQVTDGKATTPAVQPLWAFEQNVRSDPRWAYTDNAKAQTATMLTQLGQDWGFA